MTLLLRAITAGYRSGLLPQRGTGAIFDKTPIALWGGESVTVDTQFGPMLVPLRDHGPRQILAFGYPRNEVHETTLLAGISHRISSAIDIGANVGWYTRVLGSQGARVVAFEPNTHVFPFTQANASSLPDATAAQLGVGERCERLQFYQATSSDLSSASRPVGVPVEIETVSLDAFTEDGGIAPEFIKCDVEGGEMQVLRGARRLRSGSNAPAWLLEVNEEFLCDQGWTYEDMDAEISMFGEVTKFAPDDVGEWRPLAHLADLRGTRRVNVLLVPHARQGLVRGLVRD